MPLEQFPRLNIWGMIAELIKRDVPVLAFNGTPTNGTTGSFAGKAGLGALLIDYSTGTHYVNLGTKASPTWNPLSGPVGAGVAGALVGGGLGVIGNAKMTYSFAVDGGAIATLTPTNSPTVPIGAIILGGVIDVTTTLTSGGAATIALGFGAGAQVAALKAATGVASYSAGLTLPVVPVFTAATYYKLTAAAKISLTVAAAALTAGVMDINLVYLQGN